MLCQIPPLILFEKVQFHNGPSENSTTCFLDSPWTGNDLELLSICNPWSPAPVETTSSQVPRVDLASGSCLPLLSALTPPVPAGYLFCIRLFVPCLLPGLKQISFLWMQCWKKICLRWPKAIVTRPTSIETFESIRNSIFFPFPFRGSLFFDDSSPNSFRSRQLQSYIFCEVGVHLFHPHQNLFDQLHNSPTASCWVSPSLQSRRLLPLNAFGQLCAGAWGPAVWMFQPCPCGLSFQLALFIQQLIT